MADSSESAMEELMSIVGVSHDEAKELLSRSENNIQIAVHKYLESQQKETAEEDEVRAPIPQRMDQLLPSRHQYGAGPSGLRSQGPRLVVDSLRDFAEETKLQELLLRHKGSASTSMDSKSKYTKSLGLLFRPPYDLMFAGSFQAACSFASNNKKWLLVNIHNSEEFASQLVNRDLWSNEEVKKIVKDNFVLWLVSSCSQDGTKFCQFYPVESWPYIAILDPVTRGKVVDIHTADCDNFMTKCKRFLSKYDPSSEDWRKETGYRRCLSEEEELQRAIQASLDESMTQQAEETQNSSDEESDTLETFESSDSDVDYCLPATEEPPAPTGPHLNRNFRKSEVHPEENNTIRPPISQESPQKTPSLPVPENPPEEEYMLSIRLKLPSGKTRKTELSSSCTVSSLLDYIESTGCPISRHKVLAMYPRRIISECPGNQTLQQAGLKFQEILYVEEL